MVMQIEYTEYISRKKKHISELMSKSGLRPVLFIGCGLSKRYTQSPSWIELLKLVGKRAGIDDKEFNYISQKVDGKPEKIGSEISKVVHEWAWSSGKNSFPEEYFAAGMDKSIFFKRICADILNEFEINAIPEIYKGEIESLVAVDPHAIITTNFDKFIDKHFPDFEFIIGEKIIPMNLNVIGECFKIHGSTDIPESLIITEEDYQRFMVKRKYISSKVLTYFAEFPVFIVGYSLNDPNVTQILSDLGEALCVSDGYMENVFYIEWVDNFESVSHLKEEHVIPSVDGVGQVRVNAVMCPDFDWLFKTIAPENGHVKLNKKTLRGLASKVVALVRHDAPTNKIEFDYNRIEELTGEDSDIAKLIGITKDANPNADWPFTLADLALKVGLSRKSCQKLHPYIKAFSEEKGSDIKSSDNKYHIRIKTGLNSGTRKYSREVANWLKDKFK